MVRYETVGASLRFQPYVSRPGLGLDPEMSVRHEYMTMVAEHPDWDSVPFESSFADDFGHFDSLADVFRQIGHDERVHKLESETLMKKPRFH